LVENIALLDQIIEDIQAGILVSCVQVCEVQGLVAYFDFGLWDDEYLCLQIPNADNTEVEQVKISGKRSDIVQAQKDKEVFERIATRIAFVENLKEYIQEDIKSM